MLRMKHEKHGWCHAENKNQENYLRELGWIGENEDMQIDEPEKEILSLKRRGRPKKVINDGTNDLFGA
jgi:hypothetical protein